MGVASLSLSLPSGDHPAGIQKYVIPIYQVGNQWEMYRDPVIVLLQNAKLQAAMESCLMDFGYKDYIPSPRKMSIISHYQS